ncbi:class I SAM-dependent methyltransferase, partial [Flavihumibacter cheonanensis]|uniref:class I SAM-dependent methyltransferase n=1 Tax=Flavihumibacter cheonanensis TaxID=1442385 RepID=UPI001EF7A0F3
PFADDAFDAVVSFETLEHLEDHDGLLREFRRVLKPGGFLLISSPDKAVYSERLQNRNPFHLRELHRDELEALLGRHFPACRLWGQKLGFHSAIWS